MLSRSFEGEFLNTLWHDHHMTEAINMCHHSWTLSGNIWMQQVQNSTIMTIISLASIVIHISILMMTRNLTMKLKMVWEYNTNFIKLYKFHLHCICCTWKHTKHLDKNQLYYKRLQFIMFIAINLIKDQNQIM